MTDLAIPTLPSRSLARTQAFYERLGFTAERFGDPYLIVERGSLELHFFPYPDLDPASSSFGAYLRVDDVDALHAAFARAGLPAQGIPRLTAPEHKPWGMREFALVDLDGSLLRVGRVVEGGGGYKLKA